MSERRCPFDESLSLQDVEVGQSDGTAGRMARVGGRVHESLRGGGLADVVVDLR